MLNENIKNLRMNKGLTQEELAIRLHVVRQTVSKWEKGISVPDAEMLQKIAQELETEVSVLLGATVNPESDTDQIAEQLAKISQELAVKNRRWRTFWKVLGIAALAILLINLVLSAAGMISFHAIKREESETTEITVPYEDAAPINQ